MPPIDPQVLALTELVGDPYVDWDHFDSQAYFNHNYGDLRIDDRRIIEIVSDFFQRAFPANKSGRAIDVGSGANLYPALTMLPYASGVTLFERAFTNREWLENEIAGPRKSWKLFWDAISAGRPAYANISNPWDLLHRRAEVVEGNVFSLAPDQYDMGTMFFVAESITARMDKFEQATRRFIGSLKAGAPFAAAFMRDSSGYIVGDQRFPACSVSEADVRRVLAPVARMLEIETVESNDLRDGYCGMMVATGRKKK
ncbi:SCO2525 family SAM-dependent methyltransferase [Paractinoplanes atraurantiacus]|uniref:NNMT/PNMT/TEMT family protein n=1 Tax=Paractinoplanes atraurantiacus TaxID=1036182 RepID=A0A285IM27_9ACTN|nr:SCO2525 family SAM-dependent methyltransferase [Actinoplanes atraurantiacus]SNY49029.1 NNMT/PNMT/TEMT family protein [Actinoplanes atraurantiacus]